MSIESERLETATDVCITATERAENFENVLVFYLTKDDSIGFITNIKKPSERIGLLETLKHCLVEDFLDKGDE
jgi:hypothetical protein